MRIKKFTCLNCGAPKVNEYSSPYIVCDFCGSFTDIDYTLGFDSWNSDTNRTARYQIEKIAIESSLSSLAAQGKRDDYYNLQVQYWDMYYKIYPEYLPPSINTEEKYKTYLEIAAVSSTEQAFDVDYNNASSDMINLQNSLKYFTKNGRTYVEADSFFPMVESYIGYLRSSFRKFYDNPEYSAMKEFLPEDVHLKMKVSSFVQIWIPYLTDEDATRFLKMTGFNQQYIDLVKPEGAEISCPKCSAVLFIPEGSYKLYCESCHNVIQVRNNFNCMSCGAENTVPDNPSQPVDCSYCSTENRLIKPLFG